jgi:hypothetical protein
MILKMKYTAPAVGASVRDGSLQEKLFSQVFYDGS